MGLELREIRVYPVLQLRIHVPVCVEWNQDLGEVRLVAARVAARARESVTLNYAVLDVVAVDNECGSAVVLAGVNLFALAVEQPVAAGVEGNVDNNSAGGC